ncbi:hypothetical protein [Gelidibacter japonicus]|uniref:hypothetical protein n=1 Tax=Gelidibacter japonicus TaxID=1962232 RepID=UPI001963A7C8|nr:hypothetical protein [Gelidibacter japonicus]
MNLSNNNKITTLTGIAIVVANMIGTGAFTSLGFQLKELNNPSAALCRSLLMGVFYEFTFALILIDAFPVNRYRVIIKRKRADTDADPSSEQQKLIV